MAYTLLMCQPFPKFLVLFASRRHSGILALVTWLLPSYTTCSIVMNYLSSLVIKSLQCVMLVNKAKFTNYHFLFRVM